MADIKSMDVSTVISSIASGLIKVNDIAQVYGKTDRTIQKHIKALGYVWSAKERKYLPTGDSYSEGNDTKLFSEFVEFNNANSTDKKTKSRVNSTNKSTIKSTDKGTDKIVEGNSDNIDLILFGKSIDNNRVQRAYYIDKDLAGIIDGVDNKQKSNLVNACLRKIFEEKGLL